MYVPVNVGDLGHHSTARVLIESNAAACMGHASLDGIENPASRPKMAVRCACYPALLIRSLSTTTLARVNGSQ